MRQVSGSDPLYWGRGSGLGCGPMRALMSNPVWRQGMESYFRSKVPLTAALHYVLALASVLFVIWPKSQYLRIGSPPLTFSIVAIVATLIMAYQSFGYGAGKLGGRTH